MGLRAPATLSLSQAYGHGRAALPADQYHMGPPVHTMGVAVFLDWSDISRPLRDCVLLAGFNPVRALQVAQKPFRLTDDFVAPKGTLIMPSIVAANMQVGLKCLPQLSALVVAT